MLYVQDQFSYDNYNKNSANTYRLVLDIKNSNNTNKYSTTSPPIGPYLVENFPEIKEAVRVRIGNNELMESKYFNAYEENIVFADSNFFDLFPFPLASGNIKNALNEPNELVITSEIAKKYFGEENPIGKIINMDKRFHLKVTGVISPKKYNSHIKFDFLISFSTFPSTLPPGYSIKDWGWNSFFTYLKINDNSDVKNLEAKLPATINALFNEKTANVLSLHLEPLKDVYFDNERIGDFGVSGNKPSLYIISIIAFLILIIAGFNFINLSTAKSVIRSKEVGIRKLLGAERTQLISQFLGESVTISFFSILISFTIVELFLPEVNTMLNTNLSLTDLGAGYLILIIFLLPFLIGIVAGIFPAIILSNFMPSKVLKGNIYSGKTGISLRKILITAQFLITTILIAGALVVTEQINYIKYKNLGFNKENILVLRLHGSELLGKYAMIKNSFLTIPNIVSIGGATNGMDGNYGTASVVLPKGNKNTIERYDVNIYPVDYGFFKTLDIKFISGRNFNKAFATDSNSVVLNESAVKLFNLKKAVGSLIGFVGEKQGRVIGVVKDFNYTSLHNNIAPLVFFMSPSEYGNMFIRIKGNNISDTIQKIKGVWDQIVPGYPLEYLLYDQKIDRIYKADQSFASITYYFSSLAIMLACLGLFGLVSFLTVNRTKEVGIRKVLGASVPSLLKLLLKNFLLLVLIANLISWPVAYYFMNKWLEDFAYRINIGVSVFILTAFLSITIAFLTIVYQALKVANSNPVEALRYE